MTQCNERIIINVYAVKSFHSMPPFCLRHFSIPFCLPSNDWLYVIVGVDTRFKTKSAYMKYNCENRIRGYLKEVHIFFYIFSVLHSKCYIFKIHNMEWKSFTLSYKFTLNKLSLFVSLKYCLWNVCYLNLKKLFIEIVLHVAALHLAQTFWLTLVDYGSLLGYIMLLSWQHNSTASEYGNKSVYKMSKWPS